MADVRPESREAYVNTRADERSYLRSAVAATALVVAVAAFLLLVVMSVRVSDLSLRVEQLERATITTTTTAKLVTTGAK